MLNTAKTTKSNIIFGTILGIIAAAAILQINKAHANNGIIQISEDQCSLVKPTF